MAKKTKTETETRTDTETTEKPAKATRARAAKSEVATAAVTAPTPLRLVPNQPASDETRPNRSPTHEEISRRAHELWVQRQGVGGTAQEDWLRAEQELRAG